MPSADKAVLRSRFRRSGGRTARAAAPSRVQLRMPVTGMEAEFNVVLDGDEIDPRAYWGHPAAFIDQPLLTREKSSCQIPTGGAARVVRNLWEQTSFVRDELTKWEKRTGHHVRLKAYSTHYNVSFELPRSQQTRERNVKALALLLAYILPAPLS